MHNYVKYFQQSGPVPSGRGAAFACIEAGFKIT